MARPGSVEVGGYFPTPGSILPHVASLVVWPERRRHGLVLDPCAGDGTAVRALCEAWSADPGSGSQWAPNRPSIVACELERERARALQASLGGSGDRAFHGDSFRLVAGNDLSAGGGASVLYLNPPYDHDPEHGRLEQRFLARFTGHLAAGSGVLLLLVPYGALPASAELLATAYAELRCWRLPPAEFEAFGQVLVAGRRRSRALDAAPRAVDRVLRWARSPEELPVLSSDAAVRYRVPGAADARFRLDYVLAESDLEAAAGGFEPWRGETGERLSARELLGALFPVALPPKPAHIALALASGMFNGHRLEPDAPDRLPPILAKGAYSRESVEIDRKESSTGAVSVTAVDRPRLRVTVLRLDTGTFHTLAEGIEPAGGDDMEQWTAADLLLHYGRSMAELLRRQFPPLHDPADPEGQIELPALAREPFGVQSQAIQAALKLLATGRNPMFTAEVGTGKTTMALFVAAALSPRHHRETLRQLERVGLPGSLPLVRRTLVLCPPHLLGSWRDQAEAVVPEARVRIVETVHDLAADAELYVLSRETAKLGHGHAGVDGRCPGCGAPLARGAETNASRRLRCEAEIRRPRNLFARLAVELAAVLVASLPEEDLVGSLAPERWREVCEGSEAVPVSVERVERFRSGVLRALRDALEDRGSDRRYTVVLPLLQLAGRLTEAAGGSLEVLADRLAEVARVLSHPTNGSFLLQQVPGVRRRAVVDDRTAEEVLLGALEELDELAEWHEEGVCGEPLFQAAPPRRVPLAKRILRSYRDRFDLVILDEAHEFNHARSAQSKAAHRLTGLPGVPTLALTGSLMGGYASSLFTNFHALSPAFRREFGREDRGTFVARYGYQKVRLTLRDSTDVKALGRYTDREIANRRVIGEAPGVHPLFLMRYLLDTAIPVHKADLEEALPPLVEAPAPLAVADGDVAAGELLAEYERMQGRVLERIHEDRFEPELSGRLLGSLVELPSYLDRATEDLEPFQVAYPESVGGAVVARGRAFPSSWRTPKEAWLLAELERRVAAGERVIVFVRHTRTRLPERLLELVKTVVPSAVFLDVRKVPTKKREAWIDRRLNEPGVPVLLVNPNAVRTGLNNLIGFSTAVWYELDYSAFTYRQAIGRLHRIGQRRAVTVLIPYYAGTAQEIAFRLVAKKVTASLQVDGLDVRAALEAAGAGDGLPDGLDAALSLGRAVYRALGGGGRGRLAA